jgi:hydrogenase maturation protease
MNALKTTDKTLLIGIGNYGRSDDALGWKFIDTFISHDELFDFEYRYQLQVEDAELVGQYVKVIFIDASHQQFPDGFSFYDCTPSPSADFTTHKLEPEMVVWLADELYGRKPEAHVLAISGYSWALNHGLSKQAQVNLNNAVGFFIAYFNQRAPLRTDSHTTAEV